MSNADANRVALRNLARFVAARVRRNAPTAKSAESFRVYQSGRDWIVDSGDEGTIYTDKPNNRHPTFGHNPWVGPRKSQIGRARFIERAADAAINEAAERYADDYIRVFTQESTVWSEF